MDLVKIFREQTRQLECHLGNINSTDCCCCSVNKTQCFLIVEIGRKPGISVKELAEILRIDKSGVSRLQRTAWLRCFKAGIFESYSAGTETKPQINQDAVRIMKELYGIDMEQMQYSKLIVLNLFV